MQHSHTHTPTVKTSMSTYQLRAKKMKLQLAVLLISVLLEGSVALLRVGECLTRFEKSLKEIKANKKYCMDANVQDCCQVRYLYSCKHEVVTLSKCIIIIIRRLQKHPRSSIRTTALQNQGSTVSEIPVQVLEP